ncbi:MAG: apolipoprotein N-acyltransferase [Nitrospirae bacterium]|nr:apolipoprotein N-acyltransferase [Nitrospirota bacterium]
MKDSIIKKTAAYFPAFVSGILVILAFPVFDIYLLAWIAFVPLLVSLWGKTAREAFLSGYLFGVVSFFGTLYWIYHSVSVYGSIPFPVSICIVFLLCCYLGLFPALFAVLFRSMLKKTKLPALLIAPVIWVVLEFLRSYALTGFPWSSIGYSQYRFLPVIQISDITGIYGVSFLILAINGSFADLFLLKKRLREMPLFPLSYSIIGFSSLIILLVVTAGYGIWRLGQEREGHPVKTSVIQGSIEQDKKWEPVYQNEVLDIYSGLSQRAAETSPQLIVWPETAVPFFFDYDAANTGNLTRLQEGLGTHLLFGSVLVKERSLEKTLLSNSAVLLDKGGKTIYIYDKLHLVPFGEYVPLRSILFFIDKLVTGIGDYIPGSSYVRAGTEFGSFGTLICYEVIFPGLVRKFYTKGGDFIVNITNDAWFGRTAGPYQHFSMAVFRAIENRKPLIRAANTGISGFIDSSGRILSRTELFERRVLTGTVKTDNTLTFYTKYGDLFSYLCIVIFIILSINIKAWR